MDTGRTGCFAVAATQAAIEVSAGAGADFACLKHLLYQIDTTTWAIQFVAKFLIGRAGGIAKAAVYAGAQDAFGHVGAVALACRFAQVCLHGEGDRLEIRIYAARVEDALWIKLSLDLLVESVHGRGEWGEAAVIRLLVVTGGMAAGGVGDRSNILGRC